METLVGCGEERRRCSAVGTLPLTSGAAGHLQTVVALLYGCRSESESADLGA